MMNFAKYINGFAAGFNGAIASAAFFEGNIAKSVYFLFLIVLNTLVFYWLSKSHD